MSTKYDSLDEILTKYLPSNELDEVNRILYGCQINERFVILEFQKREFIILKYGFQRRKFTDIWEQKNTALIVSRSTVFEL